MIKARDLIKKAEAFKVGEDDLYTDIELACENVAYSAFYRRGIFVSMNLERFKKLAKRIEREFLRGEKEAKKQELGKNEALLKVRAIDIKEEIESIEEIKLNISDYRLLNIHDQLEEWLCETKPFDKIGLYTIKGVIDEYDDGLFCKSFWDFEVIDFKPLEVESDN